MITKQNLIRLEYTLLCAIGFALPLHKKLIPWVIGVFLVTFLVNGGIRRIINYAHKKYLIVTSAYYIFLLIGILYSELVDAALFDLEVKFSLLVFPFVFSGLDLSKKQIADVFFYFIIGCLFTIVLCLSYAIYNYLDIGDSAVFYYQQLSLFHHPAYFSMYLNFSVLLIYYCMVSNSEYFRVKSKILSITIILLFSFFVILLSSKIGLITLVLVILWMALHWFLKYRAVVVSALVLILLSSMMYLSFKYSDIFQVRIKEALSSVSNENVTYSTTGARIVTWKIAFDLFRESPFFGYGTGDVKYELIKKYGENHHETLVEHQLNAHNQFLQMLLAIGLVGSLFFWAYLLYPVVQENFFANTVYIGFLALILINFLTESMLETQAGVIFYAFFNSMLFFNGSKFISLKHKS